MWNGGKGIIISVKLHLFTVSSAILEVVPRHHVPVDDVTAEKPRRLLEKSSDDRWGSGKNSGSKRSYDSRPRKPYLSISYFVGDVSLLADLYCYFLFGNKQTTEK